MKQTRYFVHIDSVTDGSIESTTSTTDDSGGADGWSIDDTNFYRTPGPGNLWRTDAGTCCLLKFTVNGQVIVPPTEVPADWSLVPDGLGAGDKFRLLFISSAHRNASPSNIATYNTWIQERAAAGHADIQDYSSSFRAVGSTEDMDARDNTGTTYTSGDKGVAIYWLNGNKVADEYEDFYDEDWDEEASMKNESGTAESDVSAWTGSDHDGTEAFSSDTSRALGNSNNAWVRFGKTNSADHGPLSGQTANRTGNKRIYGLSGVFQVVAANSPATGAPAISGTAQVGGVLTADLSNVTDPDGIANAIFSYQWIASDGGTETDINHATGETYRPVTADEDKTIKVRVSFTDDEGNPESLTSDATGAVSPWDKGELIWSAKMTVGSWSAFSFTWFGFTGDTSTVSVGGGTLEPNTFTHDGVDHTVDNLFYESGGSLDFDLITALGSGDFHLYLDGSPLLVESDGSTNLFSLSDHGITWSVNQMVEVRLTVNRPATGAPAITGTPQVGETLTADTSAIMDADGIPATDPFSYQWISNDGAGDSDISGATASTYTPVAGDEGNTIKVRVSFTDNANFPESLTTAATAAVEAAVQTGTLVSNIGQTAHRSPAGVSASQSQGQGFTTGADMGGYTLGSVELAVSFFSGTESHITVSIYSESSGNPGTLVHTLTTPASISQAMITFTAPSGAMLAASTTYYVVITTTDSGISLSRTAATAEDTGGASGWSIADDRRFTRTDSWTTATVPIRMRVNGAAAVSNSPATGAPAITGTPQVGELLTADTSGIADPDGITNAIFSYQWIANDGTTDSDIDDATGKTYRPLLAHLDQTIKVRVTFTDDDDNAESLTSAATAAVTASTYGQVIWAATLTVEEVTTGGNTFFGYAIPEAGSLQPREFTHDENSISVRVLQYTDGGKLQFRIFGTLGSEDFNLYLDGAPFLIESPGANTNLRFSDHGLSWIDEQQVEVRLTVNRPATGAPVITGTAEVGETLTAGISAIMDEDGLPANDQFTYQWISNDGDIDGATDSTYTPVSADGGRTIKVRVSFTDNANFPESLTSAATAAVIETGVTEVPANWGLIPSGYGGGDTFRLLFLSSTERNAEPTTISTYNTWIQGLAANGHADIQSYSDTFMVVGSTGAVDARGNTNTTYTASDKGVPIYWLNGNKAADEYEDFYDKSWDEEATMRTEAGTSTDNPEFVFTGSKHNGTKEPDNSLGKDFVRLGKPDSSESSAGPLSSFNTNQKADTRQFYGLSGVFRVAATNSPATGAPAITGTPQVGETLTADISSIADPDGITNATFSYQWISNDGTDDSDIDGATDSTYTPVAGDIGNTIKVRVKFTDDLDNEESLTSAATAATAAVTASNNPATGKPAITGTPEVNKNLTADISDIMDADGLPAADQFSYQWVRNDGTDDSDISGATGATYTLTATDEGKAVKVRVTFTDNANFPESLTSDATAVVAAETTGPILTNATVNPVGRSIELIFDENLDRDDENLPQSNAFAVTADEVTVVVGTVFASGPSHYISFLVSPNIYQGQTVKVTYTDPTAGDDTAALQDAAGHDTATFTTGEDDVPAVTNDSTVATVVTGALVSNIGQTASGSAASVSTSQSQGQGFTTGANSGGYTLGSVELDVSTFSGTASDITVSIYSESSDNPETLVHTLTTPASISLEVTTFTAPSGAMLDASTTYYVVITTTSSGISLSRTNATAEDTGGASGWSIADDRRFGQSGTWNTASVPIRMRINGPPAATDATLSGLALNDGTSDLTLTPTFAFNKTSYAASVGNAVSQITVTPEKSDSNASVEYLDGNDAAIPDADGTAAGQQGGARGGREHHQGQGHRRGRRHDRDLHGRRFPRGPHAAAGAKRSSPGLGPETSGPFLRRSVPPPLRHFLRTRRHGHNLRLLRQRGPERRQRHRPHGPAGLLGGFHDARLHRHRQRPRAHLHHPYSDR